MIVVSFRVSTALLPFVGGPLYLTSSTRHRWKLETISNASLAVRGARLPPVCVIARVKCQRIGGNMELPSTVKGFGHIIYPTAAPRSVCSLTSSPRFTSIDLVIVLLFNKIEKSLQQGPLLR